MDLSKYTRNAINRKKHELEEQAKKWVEEQNAKFPNATPSSHYPFLCGALGAAFSETVEDLVYALTAPHKYAGEIIYIWNTDCSESIECRLDYQRAEKQTHEYPGCPASVELTAAYLRGVDIYHLLSPDQISEIEEKALISATE